MLWLPQRHLSRALLETGDPGSLLHVFRGRSQLARAAALASVENYWYASIVLLPGCRLLAVTGSGNEEMMVRGGSMLVLKISINAMHRTCMCIRSNLSEKQYTQTKRQEKKYK